MNGKKWIIGFLVIYLVLGCVTICVYANDLGYFDRSAPAAGEQETESEMVSISPPEQVAMTTTGQESVSQPENTEPVSEVTALPESSEPAPTVTETVPESTQPEPVDDGKGADPALADTGGGETPEVTDERQDDTVTENSEPAENLEEEKAEDTAGAEADAAETAALSTDMQPGKFYRYTVTKIPFEDLAIHPDVDGHNGQIGYLKPGMSGYVIGRGQWRTLIEYDGKFGYISNKYSVLSEVSASEYPEALKHYSWDGSVAAAASLKGDIPEYVNTDTEAQKD